MSITKHIDIGEDEVRYGISALDVQYAKEYGQEDELFISNKNGKVYYKRMSEDDENTQIVTYDDTEYNRINLIQDMIIAHNKDFDNPLYTGSSRIPKSTDTIRYNDDTSNLVLMYYRFDLSVKGKYLKDNTTVDIADSTDSDIQIDIPSFLNIFPNSGVYIKLSGSKELNSLIAHLPNVDLRTPIKINLTYKEIDGEGDPSRLTVDYPIGFNNLIHIDLAAINNNPNSDSLSADITIHNISMETLSLNTHLTENNVDDINALNNFNDNFELTYFDMIFFTDLSSIPTVIQKFNGFKNAKLVDIIPIKDVETIIQSTSSSSIITTEDVSSVHVNNGTIIEIDSPQKATSAWTSETTIGDNSTILSQALSYLLKNSSIIPNELHSVSFIIEITDYGDSFDDYYDDSVGFMEFYWTYVNYSGTEVRVGNEVPVPYHDNDGTNVWWLGKDEGNGECYIINTGLLTGSDEGTYFDISTLKIYATNKISSQRNKNIKFRLVDIRTLKYGDVYRP